MKRGAAVLAAAGALALVPSTASAHKYTVWAGEPTQAPASAPPGTSINAFMPAKLKVHKGDSVKYLNNSFHTVSVGAKLAPLALPEAGATYAGINDPQGNPFFFNGQQKFAYNAAVFAPAGSTTVKDKKVHSSGAFGGSDSGPGKYTLKFGKVGKYKVLCLIHPGMKQTVTVLKKRAKVDTNAKVKSRIAKETAKHFKDATAAAKATIPANTVAVGVEKKLATVLAFLPNSLTVPAGTTVNFVNQSPTEVHNMVWGPAGPTDFVTTFQATTDLFPNGPGTPNQVSPPFIYGSEPVTSPGTWTYSGNEYGNGFFWSPLMDDAPGDPPAGLPGSEKITFDTPGTYKYFCAIHGAFMSGSVTVQ